MNMQDSKASETPANASPSENFARLSAKPQGLDSTEAASRLATYGRNVLEEKKAKPVFEFLKRFWGPMPWLLEIAIVLASILGHLTEAIIILLLLSVNAVIGFFNHRSSAKALELLKHRLAMNARTLRDGIWQPVDAALLVPGDIILVKLGDIVPADVQLLSGSLSVDESSLTGESLPAEHGPGDMLYTSSVAQRGEATCLVLNTGAHTFFGKTAQLVSNAKPASHQEQVMLTIVRYMMYLGVAASLFVGIYAAALHISFLFTLTFVVTFLIGAVPVALPAVLTIVQAAAGSQMAEQGALVTRLDAVEDAASIRVVCFDKTGTITQNKLSVVATAAAAGYKDDDVLKTAALASNAQNSDRIDSAVIAAADSRNLLSADCAQKSFIPFSPETRRTEAIILCEGKHYRVVKGAVPEILALCDGDNPEIRGVAEKSIAEFARKGYRTLAVARAPIDAANEDGSASKYKVSFVGIIALADPIRPDSAAMIADLRKLGVKPIMLTGDSLAIAKQISIEAGIGSHIISIKELNGLDEHEQAKKVVQVDGFAEIFPEDKFRIVTLLQKNGLLVGMTGDGVNDAPALKQAEMGIAVSNAADVAKASASVVLTREGIEVIVQAIRLSRRTYQRMLTWVINKVTKVVQVLGLLTVCFFIFKEMIVSMLGMSLLVFANDFVTMSLATDNARDAQTPNTWKVKNITLASLGIGIFLIAQGIGAVFLAKNGLALDYLHIQTFVLLTLVFTSQFRVLIVRERGRAWDSMPGKALRASTAGAIVVFFLMGSIGIIIPRLSVQETAIAFAYSLVCTAIIDVPKQFFFRSFKIE